MINICFHGIGDPVRAHEPGEDRYWVDTDLFTRLLDEIATWPQPVGISFDDGNASDASIALGELVDRGLDASFFVLAGRIDEHGSLSRSALAELVDAGMTIGTHGSQHRPWPGLSDTELRHELERARDAIAAATGAAVRTAALPLGRYDKRVLGELERLGYDRVYSSDQAPAQPDAWFQPRYSARADDTPATLRARVLDRQGARYRVRGRLNLARKGRR